MVESLKAKGARFVEDLSEVPPHAVTIFSAHGVAKNESLPWKLRDHALYIAFAPVENPRYACAIIVEHGAVAAHPQVQMARDILLFAQKRDIVHRTTAYPSASADNRVTRAG